MLAPCVYQFHHGGEENRRGGELPETGLPLSLFEARKATDPCRLTGILRLTSDSVVKDRGASGASPQVPGGAGDIVLPTPLTLSGFLVPKVQVERLNEF